MHTEDDRVRARLMRHIAVAPTGCWLWTGVVARNGYGSMQVKRDGEWVTERVHRVAYRIFSGVIPPSTNVLHSCDVRNCFNPSHLRLGSQSDNIRDMDIRSRRNIANHVRGEFNGNAKLTDAAVATIRASYTGKYGDLATLARKFGVTRQAIRYVAMGNGWAHVSSDNTAAIELAAPKPKARGERHGRAKLTEAQVRSIRVRIANGETQRAIAAELGVSTATMSLIANGKSWSHV